MYHGQDVPGFPNHPHRGFETVTYVRKGLIDHSDSLGAAARFGQGDTQWLTAGEGIVHSEMFPLLSKEEQNPLELFQIWLNLPAEDKLSEPHFAMLWDGDTPKVRHIDGDARTTVVTVIAGALDGHVPAAPPPHSWAARPEADVAIWHIRMEAGARWTVPAAAGAETVRTLYLFDGGPLRIDGQEVAPRTGSVVRPDVDLALEAVADLDVLLLQGRPIGEPVARYGPFVMNEEHEIEQAFADYRETRFGGWPWPSEEPVHHGRRRFARYPDGSVEEPAVEPAHTGSAET
jgi:quercetin 2,3-dioxygenase